MRDGLVSEKAFDTEEGEKPCQNCILRSPEIGYSLRAEFP